MRILGTLGRYGLAAAVALVALGAHLALGATDAGVPFLAAVVLAAWFWGLGPGLLLAALAGSLLNAYFVLEPVGSLWLGADDVGRLVTCVVVSVLVGALHHALRREAEATRPPGRRPSPRA